ncbi:hypothetical protein NE865_14254 [Phthorimaea operculella]|nr:hypothetical protein NE865_14254 [Phthorimaea operculella]
MNGAISFFCFTLITIEAKVLKEFTIPPEGVSMDIIMRTNSKPGDNANPPLSAMTIDLRRDRVIISTKEEPFRRPQMPTAPKPLRGLFGRRVETVNLGPEPEIENRFIFGSSRCPIGFEKRGDICFPKPPQDPEPDEPDED